MARTRPTSIRVPTAPLLAMGCAALPFVASAQQIDKTAIEEIIVTGTRKAGKSPTETLSPIDVVGGNAIADQAAFDLTDSLTAVSPSLSTLRYPIADGTALIRPVTLRNLSPDQTLVLVDGSRRHRSALVNLQLARWGPSTRARRPSTGRPFPPPPSSVWRFCVTVPPRNMARTRSPAWSTSS